MCVCLWQCVCVGMGGGGGGGGQCVCACVCSWQVGCCLVVQSACHFYSQWTKMMIILTLLWFAFCRLTRGLCGTDMFYERWRCSQSWVSTVCQLFWGVSCTAVLSLFLAYHVCCIPQHFTSFFFLSSLLVIVTHRTTVWYKTLLWVLRYRHAVTVSSFEAFHCGVTCGVQEYSCSLSL